MRALRALGRAGAPGLRPRVLLAGYCNDEACRRHAEEVGWMRWIPTSRYLSRHEAAARLSGDSAANPFGGGILGMWMAWYRGLTPFSLRHPAYGTKVVGAAGAARSVVALYREAIAIYDDPHGGPAVTAASLMRGSFLSDPRAEPVLARCERVIDAALVWAKWPGAWGDADDEAEDRLRRESLRAWDDLLGSGVRMPGWIPQPGPAGHRDTPPLHIEVAAETAGVLRVFEAARLEIMRYALDGTGLEPAPPTTGG